MDGLNHAEGRPTPVPVGKATETATPLLELVETSEPGVFLAQGNLSLLNRPGESGDSGC